MGWMIGVIVVLLVTNALTAWCWRRARDQATHWTSRYFDSLEQSHKREREIHYAIYDAMGDDWRENMAYCGGGYRSHLSNVDLVNLLIEKYTDKPSGVESADYEDRDPSDDPGYIQYLKDMDEAEDELEAAENGQMPVDLNVDDEPIDGLPF